MTDVSSEQELLEFLYACPVGLIECNAAGEIGLMNPHAMQHLLPLAGARDASNLFSAFEQHAPELRSMAATFEPATGKICDGHRIFVELGLGRQGLTPKVLACTLVKLGPDRLMATLADISQQVVQENRLRQADTWFATLLDDAQGYAALTITPKGEIASANSCFLRQTGHAPADVTGHNLADVLSTDVPGDDMRLDEQLVIAGREGWHLQEGWQRRADGERYWCQRLVVARSSADSLKPRRFSVVLRDVPRREAATADLRRLLTCDHLTGAANRRHFSQMMAKAQGRWRDLREPLSLIALDLDHFKAVNDSHGHSAGDTLLCRVTEVCTALLPPSGIFARLGGEEFGVLLPRHRLEQAMALAEQLRAEIATVAVETSGGVLQVTASLGCATLEEADGSIDALIALADKRLYAAKRAGRNQVFDIRSDVA
ncbi:GGDEF domain-containing protein [Sphingomonas faeni]|uniref:GGDEF domain-containing protein n=1 Tax=Sphingomonas faeni TaxID=185950 RepID=UPI00278641F4|nr:sensor domain-containing diguanylate cyclase [Sphingomonas faeni]MDQ0839067.1 diguanylate cyclase (GGDEF)-like protein/PAS domain S-box-containing protein [Sphingomonas faeni]